VSELWQRATDDELSDEEKLQGLFDEKYTEFVDSQVQNQKSKIENSIVKFTYFADKYLASSKKPVQMPSLLSAGSKGGKGKGKSKKGSADKGKRKTPETEVVEAPELTPEEKFQIDCQDIKLDKYAKTCKDCMQEVKEFSLQRLDQLRSLFLRQLDNIKAMWLVEVKRLEDFVIDRHEMEIAGVKILDDVIGTAIENGTSLPFYIDFTTDKVLLRQKDRIFKNADKRAVPDASKFSNQSTESERLSLLENRLRNTAVRFVEKHEISSILSSCGLQFEKEIDDFPSMISIDNLLDLTSDCSLQAAIREFVETHEKVSRIEFLKEAFKLNVVDPASILQQRIEKCLIGGQKDGYIEKIDTEVLKILNFYCNLKILLL